MRDVTAENLAAARNTVSASEKARGASKNAHVSSARI